MRHAKSSWVTNATSDHERPLNERGRRDAPRVAAHLADLDWQPEFVLSSDACRTRETSETMQAGFTNDVPVEFVRALYLASYGELLQEVAIVDDTVQTLLVLGHNPGWETVVRILTGEPVVLKTANAALLEGEGNDWQDALRNQTRWRQVEIIRARDLA